MLSFDAAAMPPKEAYHLLTGCVVPRPVAWITSRSKEGVLNAAPFSFFNVVSSDPPLLSVSVGRRDGERKDTARNIAEGGEFVVHVTDASNIGAVNQTAAQLPPDESEVGAAGLTAVPSSKIAVPGLAEAKVRMECVLERMVPLGGTDEAPGCDLIIGKVVAFHIAESVVRDGRIDCGLLQPVARLNGSNYATLGTVFPLERPR